MKDACWINEIAPDRIAAVLGGGMSASLAGQLATSARFQARVAELVSVRLGDIGSVTPEEARALAMRSDELADLSRRAGVLWHADAIARIIDRSTRNRLVELLGETDYALALDYADAKHPPGAVGDQAPETIVTMLTVDGDACLAAWVETLYPPLSARMKLMLAPALPQAVHCEWGPAIVRRLLAAS